MDAKQSRLLEIKRVMGFAPLPRGHLLVEAYDETGAYTIAEGYTGHKPREGDLIWCQDVEQDVSGVLLFDEAVMQPKPTEAGIASFIAASGIPQIGPKTAEKIASALGGWRALSALDADPAAAAATAGLGARETESLSRHWKTVTGPDMRASEAWMLENGFGPGLARRTREALGSQTGRIIATNPYALSNVVPDIGFVRADTLARASGLAADSPERMAAAAMHALDEAASREGHCGLPVDLAVIRTAKLTGQKRDLARDAIARLSGTSQLVSDKHKDVDCVYLPRHYDNETRLADSIASIAGTMVRSTGGERCVQETIHRTEQRLGFPLDTAQKSAITMGMREPLSLICGGAGTGKSTIIQALVDGHQAAGHRIMMVAPTGQAAKRMTEVTGLRASTFHLALGFNDMGQTRHGPRNPFKADVVIIDEASMMDSAIAAKLFSAIKPGTKVIMVGDPNQLRSVQEGQPFYDMIQSSRIPTTTLNVPHRSGPGSQIALNAQRILDGQVPIFDTDRANSDFLFINTKGGLPTAEMITKVVHRLQAAKGYNALRDVQVLSPMRVRDCGADHLNTLLRPVMNPHQGPSVRIGDRIFGVGDRVINKVNVHKRQLYNGDIGFVRNIVNGGQHVDIDFDGSRKRLSRAAMYDVMPNFAGSIHGAQGSEFKAVVMPLLMSHAHMLNRNLLYTGTTRSKEMMIYVGEPRALDYALSRTETGTRHTRLKKLVEERLPPLPEPTRTAEAGLVLS